MAGGEGTARGDAQQQKRGHGFSRINGRIITDPSWGNDNNDGSIRENPGVIRENPRFSRNTQSFDRFVACHPLPLLTSPPASTSRKSTTPSTRRPRKSASATTSRAG